MATKKPASGENSAPKPGKLSKVAVPAAVSAQPTAKGTAGSVMKASKLPQPSPSKLDGLTAQVEIVAGKMDKLGGAMGHFAEAVNPIIALMTPVVARIAKATQSQPVDFAAVYTPKEIAKLLKVTEKIVNEAIASGDLQARRIGSEYRIIGSSILKFFDLE